MGRYYHFSKKITDAEAKEIESQMKKIDNVEEIILTEDHWYLKVNTKDNEFSEVMDQAVNICSRSAGGVELSFKRFAYEDSFA